MHICCYNNYLLNCTLVQLRVELFPWTCKYKLRCAILNPGSSDVVHPSVLCITDTGSGVWSCYANERVLSVKWSMFACEGVVVFACCRNCVARYHEVILSGIADAPSVGDRNRYRACLSSASLIIPYNTPDPLSFPCPCSPIFALTCLCYSPHSTVSASELQGVNNS